MQLNDDEGNIGIITEERMKEADEKIIAFTQIKRLNKVVDKLEQRIATLERVLQSHAKCIGELRGKEWNFAKVQSAINIKLKTG